MGEVGAYCVLSKQSTAASGAITTFGLEDEVAVVDYVAAAPSMVRKISSTIGTVTSGGVRGTDFSRFWR